MDDILTSLIDTEPTRRKFESVQSRYQRLHVPLKDVEWNVCEYCGEIVHRMLFERHLIFHEMADVTYQLYHYEIDVEKKREEQARKIQIKETKAKRRNLGLELSSCSSSSSLPSSSEDNSGFETESSSTTNNSLIYPDNINFNKNEENGKEKRKSNQTLDWVMEELMNEKQRKKQKKRKREDDEFGFNYFYHQRTSLSPYNEDEFNKNKKSKQQKLPKKNISTKKRPPKKLIKIEEIKEETPVDAETALRDNYEHLLCLNNLGRRYEYVCVDLRNCKYFDRQGNVRVANVLKRSPSPQPVRRSTRRSGIADDLIRLI
ncbi:hypothetical protein ACQ4LE_008632 [Meloidogyne hapla]